MRLKHIAEITLNILLILLISVLLYVNIAYHLLGQVTLAVVRGRSMLPLLRENDIVVILPSNRDISLGDVVVFRNDRDEYVIHRVIAIAECDDDSKVYITKGDNNFHVDSIEVFGIASRTSKTCNVKQIEILKGFEPYIRQVYYDNTIRGIPKDRILGKALTLHNMLIRITGLISLRSY